MPDSRSLCRPTLPIKALADHPELAGFAVAFEQRGRLQILGTLVRYATPPPGRRCRKPTRRSDDRSPSRRWKGDLLFPGGPPAGAPSGVTRPLPGYPGQEGPQRALKSISEGRPLSSANSSIGGSCRDDTGTCQSAGVVMSTTHGITPRDYRRGQGWKAPRETDVLVAR